MGNFDEKAIRKTTIFELRNIARDLGVPSPTIYKKEELVEKVLKIVRGEESPSSPKSRQGRPPKAGGDFYDTTINVFDNEENEEYIFDGLTQRAVLMESKNILEEENASFDACFGYIYAQGKNFYVVDKNDPTLSPIFIPSKMALEAEIREGDYINGVCKQTSLGLILTEITDVQKYKGRKEYSSIKREKYSSNAKIEGIGNIILGGRNILKVKNFAELDEMLSSCDKGSYDFVSLNLDILLEDESSMPSSSFYSLYGQNARKNVFETRLFINKIKRNVEEGKQTIAFVNELSKIAKYQNFVKGGSAFDIKEYTFSSCLDILNTASKYENGALVTVIALLKDDTNTQTCALRGELENMNCHFIN